MASVDAFTIQRSDLNRFLFADVGVEANGMTLSVLSTLARLGMDPWDEAGRLARQPRTTAIEGLARMIAGMPASLWPLADSTPIAARLVALLPPRGSASSPAVNVARPASRIQRLTNMLLLRGGKTAQSGRPSGTVLILMAGLLAGLSLYLVGQRYMSSQDDAALTPGIEATSVPPPNDQTHPAGPQPDQAPPLPGAINKGA